MPAAGHETLGTGGMRFWWGMQALWTPVFQIVVHLRSCLAPLLTLLVRTPLHASSPGISLPRQSA